VHCIYLIFLASRKSFRTKLNDGQTIIVMQRVIKCPACFEQKREETIASLKSDADNNADCRPSSAAQLSVCFPIVQFDVAFSSRKIRPTGKSGIYRSLFYSQFLCAIVKSTILDLQTMYCNNIINSDRSCGNNGFYIKI